MSLDRKMRRYQAKMTPKTQDQLRDAWNALPFHVILGEFPVHHYSGLQNLLDTTVVGHHMARMGDQGMEVAFEFESDYKRFLQTFKHNEEQALRESKDVG